MKRKLRQMANRFRPGARQVCPECGSASLSHTACPSCGFYRGRQVLDVEA